MGSLSVQSHLSLSSSSLHFEFSSRNFKCNATLSGYKLATSRCEEAVEFHYHVFSHCLYVCFFCFNCFVSFFFFVEWNSFICDNYLPRYTCSRVLVRCVALFEAHV